ncbi:hypothetical protein [Dyadobacter sp. CY356]|uniref:hypothetical protein n=1 Tax=Dyadobacter sp. CY356 TaxID=2906442 RepID=UPI001F44F766|nr:hypothetical protein [Dyadobacter sp. CY356]MCF0054396.1 hypothetical protein [Dyadobacter sp. CY356]
MISKRKDPEIIDTSKSLLEPPVYSDKTSGKTLGTDLPSENPDLLREDYSVDDVTNKAEDETVVDLENDDDDDDLDR